MCVTIITKCDNCCAGVHQSHSIFHIFIFLCSAYVSVQNTVYEWYARTVPRVQRYSRIGAIIPAYQTECADVEGYSKYEEKLEAKQHPTMLCRYNNTVRFYKCKF